MATCGTVTVGTTVVMAASTHAMAMGHVTVVGPWCGARESAGAWCAWELGAAATGAAAVTLRSQAADAASHDVCRSSTPRRRAPERRSVRRTRSIWRNVAMPARPGEVAQRCA